MTTLDHTKDFQTVSRILKRMKTVPGGQGNVKWVSQGDLGSPGMYFRVSGGCQLVYRGLRRFSVSRFPSNSLDFDKSQIRHLTFFS